MQQLSGQDATFLYLESPGAHLHLTGLYVYQQPSGKTPQLDYEGICQLITNALDGVSELRQKLVRPPLDLDYPTWVDDPEFDISKHLRRHTGRAPRSRRALYDTLAAIHAEPLDLTRAPWEMRIIERLNSIPGFPKHCFGIVMKYHHAAIDGASGAVLVDRLHGINAVEPQARDESQPSPGNTELLVRAAFNNAASTIALARALADAAPGLLRNWWAGRSDDKPVKARVPETRFNRPVSSQRTMYATSFPLQRLRAIRQSKSAVAQGVTINDVLLTLCGGALRRWLLRHGELPAEPLVAMVPVNIRSESEDQLPGNNISTLFLPIGTHIENPLERLQHVHAASRRAKSGKDGLDPKQLGAITRNIPALPLSLTSQLMTGLGLAHRGLRLCNCTITSVPPNQPDLHLGPAPLVCSIGNGPLLDGMGLIISIYTYAGTTHLCFTSCPEMLPDPEELARGVELELASLEKILRAWPCH